MNAYLVLFLICFVPLATHRYNARNEPAASIFSKPQESPPPPPPPPPPSASLLSRLFAYLIRRPSQKMPPRKPPPASSEYTYFASPPVVKVPHRPSPVSRWFSNSAPTRARRATPPPPKQTYYRRAPLSSYAAARNAEGVITLTAFLGTEGSNVDVDMVVLMAHIQAACKHIGVVLSSPKELTSSASAYDSAVGGREREDPRSLRILSAEQHTSNGSQKLRQSGSHLFGRG